MKTQKLIVIAAIVCLLVGASGAAMALDCADGVIAGEKGEPLEIEEDIIIEGQSCTIKDVDVTGNIEVINSEHITIVSSKVSGRILVEKGRFANLVVNEARNIVVRNNEAVSVVANLATRTVRVNRNGIAFVKQNAAVVAIVCRGNTRLDSFFNTAPEEDCR